MAQYGSDGIFSSMAKVEYLYGNGAQQISYGTCSNVAHSEMYDMCGAQSDVYETCSNGSQTETYGTCGIVTQPEMYEPLPSDVNRLLGGDEVLSQVFRESVNTGSNLPMIKQELKLKILAQRHSKRLPEIKVDFNKPVDTYPLTAEELKKIEGRRKNNKNSAKKCREKKKTEQSKAIEELEKLRLENARLHSQVNQMEHEKYQYLQHLKPLLENLFEHPVVIEGTGITLTEVPTDLEALLAGTYPG